MDAEPDTIVVVDDYPDGRDLMCTILRREGFDVREAATGQEALDQAALLPSLIVLDVNLPDIDGFEVCRRIKSDTRMAGITVLQVSAAYRGIGDRVRGLEGGADAYMTLPVDRGELVATVRALLRLRRAERESAGLRAVAQLATAAAHEINNPLSVITGQLYFLAKESSVPAARVEAMQEAALRIREIVRLMLRVTKLEVAKQHPNLPEMLDLGASSDDAVVIDRASWEGTSPIPPDSVPND